MKNILIYKYVNRVNNKAYIGQTSNAKGRDSNHQVLPFCRLFYRAIQKYGWESFDKIILFQDLSLEEANRMEEELIKVHRTLTPDGYNLRSGGENKFHSEETKLLISQANKGRKLSEETKARMREARTGKRRGPYKGCKMSEENRQKLIERNKRRKGTKLKPRSTEHRKKLSAAKRGSKNPNFGKPGTMLGKKQTPESIAKRIATKLKKKLDLSKSG